MSTETITQETASGEVTEAAEAAVTPEPEATREKLVADLRTAAEAHKEFLGKVREHARVQLYPNSTRSWTSLMQTHGIDTTGEIGVSWTGAQGSMTVDDFSVTGLAKLLAGRNRHYQGERSKIRRHAIDLCRSTDISTARRDEFLAGTGLDPYVQEYVVQIRMGASFDFITSDKTAADEIAAGIAALFERAGYTGDLEALQRTAVTISNW